MSLCVFVWIESKQIHTMTLHLPFHEVINFIGFHAYLHIGSIFLHITDRDALIAVDRDSPSLVDITLAVVVRIIPLQLIRVT